MDNYSKLEWSLLQNGAVNLYLKSEIFEQDVKQLKNEGYRVEIIDCGNLEAFRSQITRALDWETQFGYQPWNGNLNALNDALRDTTLGKEGKFALACKNFSKLI